MKKKNSSPTKQDILKVLKRYLLNNELSLMVGAGFSKNASPEYKSWAELVKHMIPDAFPLEWNKLQTELRSLVKPVKDARENSFCSLMVKEYNYLGVAQKYVEKKGLHQHIDTLIEQHTPCVMLNKNGKLPDDIDSSMHEKLLGLGIKTIYTFNYDNLLEVVSNSNSLAKISGKYSHYKALEEKLGQYLSYGTQDATSSSFDERDYLALTQDDIEEKREKLKKDILQLANMAGVTIKEEDWVNLECLRDVQEHVTEEVKSIESDVKDQAHYPVRNRYDLSVSGKKGQIIKLHGSWDGNGKQGFDTAVNEKYIITQSDYDNYRIKHEPFAKLMQITLLKDKILAIGFSGDDPNFQSWIDWVSSVLQESGVQEEKTEMEYLEEAKVFLVYTSSDEIDPAKLRYFKQNKVYVIKLSNYYDGETHKELVDQFLSDLSILKANQLHSIMRTHFNYEIIKDKDTLLKNINNYYEHNSLSYLNFTSTYSLMCKESVSKLKSNLENKFDLYYMIHILNIFGQPVESVLDAEQIGRIDRFIHKSEEYPNIRKLWTKMRMKTVSGKIYKCLFDLDFKHAYELLDSANKKQQESLSEKVRIDSISALLYGEHRESPVLSDFYLLDQERSLIESIYRVYCCQGSGRKGTIKENILNFQKVLNNVSDRFDQNTKIQPYDIQRRGDVINFQVNDDKRKIYANRWLSCSMEMGITPSIESLSVVQDHVFYKCFKSLYKSQLKKMLFYLLNTRDIHQNLMKRCAQDILYNYQANEITTIVSDLLSVYENVQDIENIKTNILSLGFELLGNEFVEFPDEFVDFVLHRLDDKKDLENYGYGICLLLRLTLLRTEITEEFFYQIVSKVEECGEEIYLIFSILEQNIESFDDNHWAYDYVKKAFDNVTMLSNYFISREIDLALKNDSLRTILIQAYENHIEENNYQTYELTRIEKLVDYSMIIDQYVVKQIKNWNCDIGDINHWNKCESLIDLELTNFDDEIRYSVIDKVEEFISYIFDDNYKQWSEKRLFFYKETLNTRYAILLSLTSKVIRAMHGRDLSENSTADDLLPRAKKMFAEWQKVIPLINEGKTFAELYHSTITPDVSIAHKYAKIMIGNHIDNSFVQEIMQYAMLQLINKKHLAANTFYEIFVLFWYNVYECDWKPQVIDMVLIKSLSHIFWDEVTKNIEGIDEGTAEWEYSYMSKLKVINNRELIVKALKLNGEK